MIVIRKITPILSVLISIWFLMFIFTGSSHMGRAHSFTFRNLSEAITPHSSYTITESQHSCPWVTVSKSTTGLQVFTYVVMSTKKESRLVYYNLVLFIPIHNYPVEARGPPITFEV